MTQNPDRLTRRTQVQTPMQEDKKATRKDSFSARKIAAFSPVCPFFTHHISSTVYGSSAVDVDAFPEPAMKDVAHGTDEGSRLCDLSHTLQEFNGQTWAAKKEAGVSLNQPISGIFVPDDLAEFSPTLTRMHQLE